VADSATLTSEQKILLLRGNGEFKSGNFFGLNVLSRNLHLGENNPLYRIRKPKNRYLQNNLHIMCKGGSNQENTGVAANSMHSL